MPLAVLDANILVSAALTPSGTPAVIIEAVIAGAFDMVVSPRLLEEVEQVLRAQSPERIAPASVEALLATIRATASIEPDALEPERVVPGDSKDDYLVSLARAAGAAVIVTGDRHLLDLAGLHPPAVTPRRFLETLRELER